MSKQRSSEKPEDITGLLLAGENWKESVKRKKNKRRGKENRARTERCGKQSKKEKQMKPYGVPEIKPSSASWKASVIPIVLIL